MLLTVYVPKPGTEFADRIAPKSAIVANPETNDPGLKATELLVYFEGNVHNAVNLVEFYDRALCAAGRLYHKYPTMACQVIDARDLIAVAEYETATWSFTDIRDEASLAAWAGEPIENIVGVKLPLGVVPWKDAAIACQNGSPHGPHTSEAFAFRTRAGQYVTFKLGEKTASVSDHPKAPLE